MRSYKVLGFTIRIRCGSKYESIKGIKKLRLEVYNNFEMIKLQKRDATCSSGELASNAQNASCIAVMYLFLSTKEDQAIIPTQQQDIIYTRNHMTEILIECKGNCFSYRKLNSFAIQYLRCVTQFAGIFCGFIVSPSYCITNWNIFSLYQKFLSHHLFAVCIRTELSGDNSGKKSLCKGE